MIPPTSDGSPAALAWRRSARTELRRARRYLLSLLRDLSAEELEWLGASETLSCIKWHAGHVALRERELLGALVPALAGTDSTRDACFGTEARTAVGLDFPPWTEIEEQLAASRKLSEALLMTLPEREGLREIFLQVVNHEYEHARYVRRLRAELGRPGVAEPTGRLLEYDLEVDEAPRFFVGAFERPGPARRRSVARPAVISLEEHRSRRARTCIREGHVSVARGDYDTALALFEEAHRWEPSADALTFQGWMQSLLGESEVAERLCLEAIELDPGFGNPYNDIGTFCLQRQDVESAIRWFEKAKDAPRYEPRHFPYINLGRLYLSIGEPERALDEFEGALRHDPENAEVLQAVQQIRRELRSSRR
jgi:Tfp pilus assembly protein PilF